jgi:lipid-binding SYLF domain-containing protein
MLSVIINYNYKGNTMMKSFIGLTICILTFVSTSAAQPIRNAAKAVANTVGYVGETVGETASAVGSTVVDAGRTIAGKNDPAATRKEIDSVADTTLNAILSKSKAAKALYDASYGYAVFDSRKASILITTGKGIGVAVDKASNQRVYMHVATAGINVGAGVQFYQGLFLFENKSAFDTFVNSGWQADATAGATLGKNALEAQAKFTNGMAYYQISETGIMLDADITGTKYWKSGELNSKN